MRKEQVYKIFNRHIGRVLTILDSAKTADTTKFLVKSELWQLHDDVLQKDLFIEESKEEFKDDKKDNTLL